MVNIKLPKRTDTHNYAPLTIMMSAMIRVEHLDMPFSQCLHNAYFDDLDKFCYVSNPTQDGLRQRCWAYGFGYSDEGKLRMAIRLDTTKRLLRDSKYSNLNIDNYILNLPGIKQLFTKSGNEKRVRAGGQFKAVVEFSDELVERIGLGEGKSDDFIPVPPEEDIPF